MSRNTTIALVMFVAGLIGAGGAWIGRVSAAGAPSDAPLTYAGVVTDEAGKAPAVAVAVAVSVFDAASGGMAVCAAAPAQAAAGSGRFSVVLPSACADAVHAKADLWVEVAVGPAKVLMPRQKLGAVPYALEAAAASAAQGGLAAELLLLAKDVATLKGKVAALEQGGGGGGSAPWGPKVLDAKGALLGYRPVLLSGGRMVAFHTLKGYWNVSRASKTEPPNTQLAYFTEAGCKGEIWSGSVASLDGDAIQGFAVSDQLVGGWTAFSSVHGKYLRLKVDEQGKFQVKPNVLVQSRLATSASGDSYCLEAKNLVLTTNHSAAELVTGADVGMPDTIAYPIRVVP